MKLSSTERMCWNARAWLHEQGFPALAVLEDPAPCSDHCYLEYSEKAHAWADLMMDPWKFATGWKDHQGLGYRTARGGWRERGKAEKLRYRWAAQLIWHCDTVSGRQFFELDFDSFSPNQGAGVALAHAIWDWTIQKIRGSKTSPYTVAKRRGWDKEEGTNA